MRFRRSLFLTATLVSISMPFRMVKAAAHSQSFLSFGANSSLGQKPYVGVIQGSDGALYGTTQQGGTNSAGVVFKVNRDGTGYGVLHSFSTNGIDGQSPSALLEASNGTFYGTTSIGGSNKVGTVYRIDRDGTGYGVLHQFNSVANDGENPQAGLLEGSDGALYGTTFFGGSNGLGTVFKLNKDGSGYQVLANFSGPPLDGRDPDTALILGHDRALYGTTLLGGSNDQGTVFKLNQDGSAYLLLRSFTGTNGDGATPDAALTQASDSALYGTTYAGGSNKLGTIFKLNTDGSGYSLLHAFGVSASDGQRPLGALLEAVDGALYGTTYSGGSNNFGTIFQLTKTGAGYLVLNSFSNVSGDGQNPRGNLAMGSDNLFYGTTWNGGTFGLGTVFRAFPTPTPDMLDVKLVTGGVQVRFTGVSGYQYQILRSTNFVNWVPFGTLTMPASGIGTNLDSSPPQDLAQYRSAWVP
jgi:uncharacterized repeat protein (TIGR03803 family)